MIFLKVFLGDLDHLPGGLEATWERRVTARMIKKEGRVNNEEREDGRKDNKERDGRKRE